MPKPSELVVSFHLLPLGGGVFFFVARVLAVNSGLEAGAIFDSVGCVEMGGQKRGGRFLLPPL